MLQPIETLQQNMSYLLLVESKKYLMIVLVRWQDFLKKIDDPRLLVILKKKFIVQKSFINQFRHVASRYLLLLFCFSVKEFKYNLELVSRSK